MADYREFQDSREAFPQDVQAAFEGVEFAPIEANPHLGDEEHPECYFIPEGGECDLPQSGEAMYRITAANPADTRNTECLALEGVLNALFGGKAFWGVLCVEVNVCTGEVEDWAFFAMDWVDIYTLDIVEPPTINGNPYADMDVRNEIRACVESWIELQWDRFQGFAEDIRRS